MSKYGNKFTCWSCGTKFYDLNRPGAKCPKCNADPHQAPQAERASGGSAASYGEDEIGDFDEVEGLDDETGDENE